MFGNCVVLYFKVVGVSFCGSVKEGDGEKWKVVSASEDGKLIVTRFGVDDSSSTLAEIVLNKVSAEIIIKSPFYSLNLQVYKLTKFNPPTHS